MRKIDIIIYIVATILLVVPYSITIFSNKLEPYPAVILPDGSSKVMYNDGYIRYSKTEIIGIDAESRTARVINADSFFYPIPSNRIYGFVNNSFSMDSIRRDTFRFRRDFISPIIRTKQYKNIESKDLNEWYRSKLIAQGFSDTEFTFQEELITIVRETSEIVDSTLSRSKRIKLYD